MKLLLDENIAPRLASALQDVYPETAHVREVGLKSESDDRVWAFAQANELVIVSKDSDFRQRSFTLGFPPKVVWLNIGNCSTGYIERLLRDRYNEMLEFGKDLAADLLILRR